MEKIIVLGTSGAVTNARRDNVSLVFCAEQEGEAGQYILLECGGSAAHKLAKVGVPYHALKEIIVTHTHIDHFYGLSGLIFAMMYRDMQRETPLRISCPECALDVLIRFLDFFNLREDCPFPLYVHGVPLKEHAAIFENEAVTVTASPVDHSPKTPTFGVKIASKRSGKTMVYSGDTTYSERLIRLASGGVDLLFHECSGLSTHDIAPIHSNARHAGQAARNSGAKKLVLLHLDSVLNDDPQAILAEIRQEYAGESVVAEDFDEFIL